MEKDQDPIQQDKNPTSVDFDLTEFIGILWRARNFIATGTILISVLCMGGVLYFNQYRSEGFLQFGGAIPEQKKLKDSDPEPAPGIKLSDYKRYSAAFSTTERFSEFVNQKNIAANPEVITLRKDFSSRNGIAKMIVPIYPFTKLDAKELMNEGKDGDNNVIALNISYTADTPKEAQNTVALLGEYAIDTIIYMIYSDMLRFKTADIAAKITKLDNKIIENKEKLETFRRKGESLKKIVTRYPSSSEQAARQVVTVTEDTARYLSPVTQLMTSEVESSEATEAIYKAKREQTQYALLSQFYEKTKLLSETNKSGEAILKSLNTIKKNVFKDKDLQDETIKEVYNLISIENDNAINLYLNKTRFIAGPSFPENHSTRLSIALAASIFAGLIFSIGLALGRKWWRENSIKLNS